MKNIVVEYFSEMFCFKVLLLQKHRKACDLLSELPVAGYILHRAIE